MDSDSIILTHYPAVLLSVGIFLGLAALIVFLQRQLTIVQKLSFPLFVGAFAIAWRVFLFFYSGNETAQNVLLWALWFLLIAALIRAVGLYVFDIHLISRQGLKLPPVLPTFAIWTGYVVGGLILSKVIFSADLSALLGAGAVTSLILGLALQPILGNFFAGVVIAMERPFRINDWIRLGETDGEVVNITWRTTYLRNRNNDNLVIPNSKIANEEIINYFYPHPLHLERLHVGVHYRTPPYRVEQALLKACSNIQGVLEKPTPNVHVTDFSDSAITYELRIWVRDIAGLPGINSRVRAQIWEEFKRAGITIPFPIRTLEIEPSAAKLEIAKARAQAKTNGRGPGADLYVIQGQDRGKSIAVDAETITLGRSPECNLTLSELLASKQHARIEWRTDRYVLCDLESKHGTYVNGVRTTEKELQSFDRISVGETEIVFENHV